MAKPIRTVVLEFLREGPAHNQLLSPHTRYLARCGEANTAVVTVPFEHAQFLDLQRRLRYEGASADSEQVRRHVLDQAGKDMAQILAAVPGLIAEVNRSSDEVLHVELDLWPSEIALLPFELARTPADTPGAADSWLSLQSRHAVTLTRRLRGQTGEGVAWPRQARVLFAWSEAGGDVPRDAHRDALRRALMPWLDDENSEDWDDHGALTEIGEASIADLRRAIADKSFTHVHLLAHGAQSEQGSDFGKLTLGTRRRKEIIDGDQLSSALHPGARPVSEQPCVVTLASCDSGNEGSVLSPGGSLAHALHMAGTPFVVASQFPLSKKGSVWLARELYEGLLSGTDPRLVMHGVRQGLFSEHGASAHDWAGILCYAALPADIEDQLEEVRLARCREEVEARMSAIEKDIADERPVEEISRALDRVRDCAQRFPGRGSFQAEGVGSAASAYKRIAEARFRLCAGTGDNSHLEKSVAAMRRAMPLYLDAAQVLLSPDRGSSRRLASIHWLLTQWQSLAVALGKGVSHDAYRGILFLTRLESESESDDPWSIASRMELALIGLDDDSADRPRLAAEATLLAQQFRSALRGEHEFHRLSARRQVARYIDWWGTERFVAALGESGQDRDRRWRSPGGLLDTAKELLAILDASDY